MGKRYVQHVSGYGSKDGFTVGKVYKLLNVTGDGNIYELIDDNNRKVSVGAIAFDLLPESEVVEIQKHDHYFVDVSHLQKMDVYRVLERFKVTCPVLQHVSKKALCAGNRKHKDLRRDIQDMIDSLTRKLEMMNEDDVDE